jgi:glycerol-3-phosphate dehydrogenase
MAEGKVSRKHTIIETDDGLTTIAGGKLTTWRKMAEETFYHVIKKLKTKINKEIPEKLMKEGYSRKPMLIGLKRGEWDNYIKENDVSEYLPEHTLTMLYQQYGKGAMEIIASVKQDPSLGEPFIQDVYIIPAEIYYVLKYELCPRLIDVMCRRTEISLKIRHTQQREVAEKVAEIMADAYKWDEAKKLEEIEHYAKYIAKTTWF